LGQITLYNFGLKRNSTLGVWFELNITVFKKKKFRIRFCLFLVSPWVFFYLAANIKVVVTGRALIQPTETNVNEANDVPVVNDCPILNVTEKVLDTTAGVFLWDHIQRGVVER